MSRLAQNRSLQIESLENRSLMAGIPQFNSAPGALNTIYLDFDGHFEPTWGKYSNVGSYGYNRDGNADFNAAEINDVRRVWNMVSEDFAPFNVNVTTVAPTAGDPRALRVVIAGQNFAQYVDHGQWKWSTGTNFVMASNGVPERGSGSAFVGSFINSQPNTVYVFSDTVDNFRPLTAEQIGNTASHVAGSAFGLVHHQQLENDLGSMGIQLNVGWRVTNEFAAGDGLTTPIMGNTLVTGTRHVWTNATNMRGMQNQVEVLGNVLGNRSDEAGADWGTARALTWSTSIIDPRAVEQVNSTQVWGVVSSTNDRDAYRFRTTEIGTLTVEGLPRLDGNLDVRLELFRIETGIRVINGVRQNYTQAKLIASDDPAQSKSWGEIFGLNAGLEARIPAGDYMVVVTSHGAQGDMGNYRLSVSHRTPVIVNRSASLSASWASAADLAFASLAAEATPPKRAKTTR